MSADVMKTVHGTSVARYGRRGWRGVLLTGPSGAGKSDLALRLIGEGWRLVADDYSEVWRSGDAVWATAPTRIEGRMEVRGLGIVPVAPRWIVRLDLVVACGQAPVERLPEPAWTTVAGVRLPELALDVRPASAGRTVGEALAGVLRQV